MGFSSLARGLGGELALQLQRLKAASCLPVAIKMSGQALLLWVTSRPRRIARIGPPFCQQATSEPMGKLVRTENALGCPAPCGRSAHGSHMASVNPTLLGSSEVCHPHPTAFSFYQMEFGALHHHSNRGRGPCGSFPKVDGCQRDRVGTFARSLKRTP